MDKTKRRIRVLLAIISILFCMAADPAWALDRMGPATASLGQGTFAAGVDYAWSQTDLRASGSSVYTYSEMVSVDNWVTRQTSTRVAFTMKDVDTSRLYASFGYGCSDRVDAFLRVGGAQTDWTDDGGTHLAFSGGVRSTFYEAGPLRIGGLAQVSWTEAKFDDVYTPGYHVPMKGKLSLWEFQLGATATYQLFDYLAVYGGPFLYLARGDLDLKQVNWGDLATIPEVVPTSLKDSFDIEEASRLAGCIGAEFKVTPQVGWGIECLFTADATAVTTGAAWRF